MKIKENSNIFSNLKSNNNMQPENVRPGNFTYDEIVYNQNGFSIAIGTWHDDETRRFAMRWNEREGMPEDDIGYPSARNNPMWFQLPNGSAEITNIIRVLSENIS